MRWRRYYLGGAIIPPIDAREPEDGVDSTGASQVVYVITQVTRKARQWRTNGPNPHPLQSWRKPQA